ncbi:MAG: hypothetical protein JNK87_13380 [Bryobacterales bacterium]|nr:hypothetical protein [Bryobacterales bacterium]
MRKHTGWITILGVAGCLTLASLPGAAQEAAAKPAAQAEAPKEAPKAEAKPEAAAGEAKPEEKPAEAAAEPEKPFTASFELGARWNAGVGGNLDTYRSMVNLGEGPRLLNWEMRLNKSTFKGVEKAHFRGSGWGGDPSSWLQFAIEQSKWYRLTLDHRSTAYFSALPSFANPQLERGILFSQRSFDTTRRFTEVQVDLIPTSRIVPYFGYMRDQGFGRGVSPFVTDSNEYPVLTNMSDLTNLARGGVRMQFNRMHVTLEQGGLAFSDNETLSTADRNLGNRPTPIFGQTLVLNNLLQAYEVDGSSIYSKGLFTAQPLRWLDLSGAFQFSQPRNDVNYRQLNEGRFIDLDALLFFNSQSIRLIGAAKQPHVTANLGAEIRPVERLRILQSWITDRLHNSSALRETAAVDRLEWNYDQAQTEALVEVTRRLSVRGGWRYTWGDGLNRAAFILNAPYERGELRRNAGLAGVAYRVTDKFSLNADTEIARSSRVLFRNSLSDYERVRLRGRYTINAGLQLYGNLQFLDNNGPPKFGAMDLRSQQMAMGFQWMPKGGQTLRVLGEYARSVIRSNLSFYDPRTLGLANSNYRDYAHTVTGLVTWRIAAGWTWQPQLSFGGTMFSSSGSRPTDYYQPVVRFTAPIARHVDLVSEYRWFGVSQAFYAIEGFRSHQGIVGIRIY